MDIKYFDNSATTKVREEVINEMFPFFSIQYGNPSSLYTIGRYSRRAVENARRQVAGLLNCNLSEIYFTGSGSEGDNLALKGIAYANRNKGNHIITSKIEHHAVLNSCKTLERQGFKVSYINVDNEGKIDLQELVQEITNNTILISVMFANNEIGTIQPIEEIAKIAKKHNIIFHTDAVQACGNLPIDVKKLGIDLLTISGHKIYAPKGVGALYVKNGIDFERIIDGGGQERGKRSGTENVPQIVGLGKACELANLEMETHTTKLRQLRDYFIEKIEKEIPTAKLNGSRDNRLPGNSNFSFKNVDGQTLLLKLDQKGICVSSGSACSAGNTAPSHVLTAIGLDKEYAQGTIRVTFGKYNTKEEVDFLIENIKQIVAH